MPARERPIISRSGMSAKVELSRTWHFGVVSLLVAKTRSPTDAN
jgi:hypothetical protein